MKQFKHPELDGEWNRLLPDGILETRNPNDGQGFDPETKSRYQYRIERGIILKRHLPPAGLDEWLDDPEASQWHAQWHAVELPPTWPLLQAYWEFHGGTPQHYRTSFHTSVASIDVGYDLRREDQPVELKPSLVSVFYTDKEGYRQLVAGDYHSIIITLAAAGYDNLIVDRTPNGREIQFADGKYLVQPGNDNFRIHCDTLEEAHKAYFHGKETE